MKRHCVIIGYLLFTASTFTMQQPAARTIGERFIKPFISKAATAAHWGISYGPFLGKGLGSLAFGMCDKEIGDWVASKDIKIKYTTVGSEGNFNVIENTLFAEADSSLQKLVEEQAKKINAKIPSVKLMGGIPSRAMATERVVCLDLGYAHQLMNALEKEDKKKIDEGAAIIQHELNHNKDHLMLVNGISYLTIPLLNHRLIKIGKKALSFAPKIISFAGIQSAKISSGVGKYFLNDLELKKINRMQEQRADDGICDDVNTLQGIRDHFVDMQKEEGEIIQNINDRRLGIIMRRNFPIIFTLFARHPTFEHRVAKFDERIEKLKKQSNA